MRVVLTKFLKSIEPTYDWGTREVSRMDAICPDFTDESYGGVRFFELQWLGLHFEVQLGRTPRRATADEIAAAHRNLDRRDAEVAAARATASAPSPVARHLQLVRSGSAQAVPA